MKRTSVLIQPRRSRAAGAFNYACIMMTFLAAAFNSCAPLINRVLFNPDRSYTVPAADLPENVERQFITGSDNVRLECYYLTRAASKKIVIYLTGNGGNITHCLPDLLTLRNMGTNVIGVGYRGYGASMGRPSEKGICRDGETVFRYVTDSLGYAEDSLFVFGRSIGSTVALATAQNRHLAGIILITPFSTGSDQARAHSLGWITPICRNHFDNMCKATRIQAPVLVIHGTDDEVIPFRFGRKLFDALPGKKTFVIIDKGMHSTLESVDPERFWSSIDAFINRRD